MSDRLANARAALMPEASLSALGPLRTGPLTVVCHEGQAWLTWNGDRPEIVACVLQAVGAVLYEPHGPLWHRLGSRLPDARVPLPGQGQPLDRVLMPAAMVVIPPPATIAITPRAIQVVPSSEPRPTTALLTDLKALAAWSGTATTRALSQVRAACCRDRVLLVGAVPALAGLRLWGEDLLLPVGWRADPDWPESALRSALHLARDELGLLTESGAEAIPRSEFAPLTRGSIRLAAADEFTPEARKS